MKKRWPWRAVAMLVACALGAVLSEPVFAQQPLRQDVDYRLIPQQPVANDGKIEVIEFFWYGCPYCNELQPHLEAWLKHKPKDVEFRLIPAILHDEWEPHVRIFYTLQALGELQRLHSKVYYSYHVDKLSMSRADVMADWAVRNGIDRDKWLAAYTSPKVTAQIEQARALTAQYDIQGTPSLVVDGRYLTSGGFVNATPDLIPVLDGLIRMSREARGAQPR